MSAGDKLHSPISIKIDCTAFVPGWWSTLVKLNMVKFCWTALLKVLMVNLLAMWMYLVFDHYSISNSPKDRSR